MEAWIKSKLQIQSEPCHLDLPSKVFCLSFLKQICMLGMRYVTLTLLIGARWHQNLLLFFRNLSTMKCFTSWYDVLPSLVFRWFCCLRGLVRRSSWSWAWSWEFCPNWVSCNKCRFCCWPGSTRICTGGAQDSCPTGRGKERKKYANHSEWLGYDFLPLNDT